MEFGDIPRPSRHGAGRAGEAMNLGRLSHPDVLWGNAGTPGPPSMAKTMAQLEAGLSRWARKLRFSWNGFELAAT
eukprot:symbB.v1.2.037141.t1/scaffold5401.1/size27539/6